MGDNMVYTQGKLTFILIGDKVIIKTSLGQQFYLLPKAHYWQRRLTLIRYMVSLGEVRSLNELASYTNPGITWEVTSEKYELDNIKERAYN